MRPPSSSPPRAGFFAPAATVALLLYCIYVYYNYNITTLH